MIHQIIKGLKKICRESKRKSYINQYNWKEIKFPSDKEDWTKFKQNNKEIALNVLFIRHNKKNRTSIYIKI